eukprot:CAMPEP_0177588486 /NCGR_PEP_ID=MMETSP0419_2-20121207/6250_1 /TAXON_ID=582737 /ORGANISM="Tetraselmis sp., Strain GSL018" /LENGTH=164 /DNA_ID=CAMNT_0019078685 /DNA_START=533 /DNA_END=1023 /DNA_ORIENTATION=-
MIDFAIQDGAFELLVSTLHGDKVDGALGYNFDQLPGRGQFACKLLQLSHNWSSAQEYTQAYVKLFHCAFTSVCDEAILELFVEERHGMQQLIASCCKPLVSALHSCSTSKPLWKKSTELLLQEASSLHPSRAHIATCLLRQTALLGTHTFQGEAFVPSCSADRT